MFLIDMAGGKNKNRKKTDLFILLLFLPILPEPKQQSIFYPHAPLLTQTTWRSREYVLTTSKTFELNRQKDRSKSRICLILYPRSIFSQPPQSESLARDRLLKFFQALLAAGRGMNDGGGGGEAS